MINPSSIDASTITASPDLDHRAVACQSARELYRPQEANPPDSRRAFSQASTSRSSQRKAEPTRIAGGPSPRMRHARKQPTLTVRRSATCLMVRSRGAVPVECDCPIDFFITSPVQMSSLILSRLRRAAFDSDPAQAAASRANGQHWLRPSVLGTPWRDHPSQAQLSANTRATFDGNRLGWTSRPSAKGRPTRQYAPAAVCSALSSPAGSTRH